MYRMPVDRGDRAVDPRPADGPDREHEARSTKPDASGDGRQDDVLPDRAAGSRRGGRRSSPSGSPPSGRRRPTAGRRRRRSLRRVARSRAGSCTIAVMLSTVTMPRSAPVRSTTMPAWTSASSSIESASLSVVRRSRRGDVGIDQSAARRVPGRERVAVDPADRAVAASTSEQVRRSVPLGARLAGRSTRVARRPAAVTTGASASSPTRNRRQPLEPAVRADEPGDELGRGAGEDLGRRPELRERARRLERPRRGRPS